MIEDLIRTHVAASLAGLADDAVWITGKTTVRGRAALTGLFAGAMDGLLPTLTIQNLIASGSQAAVQPVEVIYRDGSADVTGDPPD